MSQQKHIICQLSYLSFRCKYNPVLLQDRNQRHLHLKQSKPHSNAVSWAVPKGQVSTRMTLGLLFRSEPANTGSYIDKYYSIYNYFYYSVILYSIIVIVSHCNLRAYYLLGSNLSGSLYSSGLLCSVGDENSTYIPFFMGRSPTTQSSVHTREDLNQWENNIHISAFKTKLKAVRIMPVCIIPRSIAHSHYFIQKHTAYFIIMRGKA